LIAEDIAYDAASKTFFVSSVHKRKIIAVAADGSVTDLNGNVVIQFRDLFFEKHLV
jgi:hypothetical protein